MYQTILHATDLGEQHLHLCDKAIAMAQYCNAKIYFIHVIALPTSLQVAQGLGFAQLALPDKDGALAVMAMLAEQFKLPAEQFIVETGSVADQVVQQAAKLDADLILIGQHQHGIAHLGNHAEQILRHSPCDVLSLKYMAD